jgi:hypothetical protein
VGARGERWIILAGGARAEESIAAHLGEVALASPLEQLPCSRLRLSHVAAGEGATVPNSGGQEQSSSAGARETGSSDAVTAVSAASTAYQLHGILLLRRSAAPPRRGTTLVRSGVNPNVLSWRRGP